MKKVYTSAFVIKDDKVLLGYKKRGFGVGKWNGFGGKPNPGESVEQAAARELIEECGIEAIKLEEKALLVFTVESNPEIYDELRIYTIEDFEGIPVETEEMRPKWFYFKDVPYDQMWEDARLWLPPVLKGKRFKFTGHYSSDIPGIEYRDFLRHELIEEVHTG